MRAILDAILYVLRTTKGPKTPPGRVFQDLPCALIQISLADGRWTGEHAINLPVQDRCQQS
jgi:hypothetical protein